MIFFNTNFQKKQEEEEKRKRLMKNSNVDIGGNLSGSVKSSERERLLNVRKGIEQRNKFVDRNKSFLESQSKPLMSEDNNAKVGINSEGKINPFEINPVQYDFLITETEDANKKNDPFHLSKSFQQLEAHPNREAAELQRLREKIVGVIENQKARKRLDKILGYKTDLTFEGHDNLKSLKRRKEESIMAISGFNMFWYFWDLGVIYILMANLYFVSLK